MAKEKQNRKGAGRPIRRTQYRCIPPTYSPTRQELEREWEMIKKGWAYWEWDEKAEEAQRQFEKRYIGYYYEEEPPFCSLATDQLEALLPIMNENFFVEALTASEWKEVFDGKRTAKVKNIGAFAYVLNELSKQGFIVDNWQHQAEAGKMFVSTQDIPLTAKKLSKRLSEFNDKIDAYKNYYSKDDIPPTYKAKMRLKSEIDNLLGEL